MVRGMFSLSFNVIHVFHPLRFISCVNPHPGWVHSWLIYSQGCSSLYGLWWMFASFWFQLTSAPLRVSGKGKTGSRELEIIRKSYMPQPFLSKLPLEPVIKCILSVVGMIGEGFFEVNPKTGRLFPIVYHIYDESGKFNDQAKIQHITMYLGFALSGIVDILVLFIEVPRHTSKIFLSIAFFLEGLLFWFHANGRPDLDLMVHKLVNYTIFACAGFATLRMWQPFNLFVNTGLSFSMLLQGVWFIHLGVVLYIQKWNMEDHRGIMFTVACYSWYIVGIMFFLLVMYILMHSCLRISVKYQKGRCKRGLQFLAVLPTERNPMVEDESKNLMEGDESKLGLLAKHDINKTVEESHT